jgi:hypothetical protein
MIYQGHFHVIAIDAYAIQHLFCFSSNACNYTIYAYIIEERDECIFFVCLRACLSRARIKQGGLCWVWRVLQ